MSVIERRSWYVARQHHQLVVSGWVDNRLRRRSHGLKHPVDDFMFEYYPISPNKLKTWHPGIGHNLQIEQDDKSDFKSEIYMYSHGHLAVSQEWLNKNVNELEKTIQFLTMTANRNALNSCFGLHEWAMVLDATELRHQDWPLRVSQDQIRDTISSVGLRCTHFDAFRFFTPVARPLNPLQLTRSSQPTHEQPGCLHANMDLYKTSHRWAPIVGSTIVRSAFRLARDIRSLDMQSAPYDLTELGVDPIELETSAGRSEFAIQQKAFSVRAQKLRNALLLRLTSALKTTETNQVSVL